MEDGTFTTVEGEEWDLPGEGQVGLLHPIEFSKKMQKDWKEHMADYEIVPPIKQMEREVFYQKKEEMEEKRLKWFEGWRIEGKRLYGFLEYGWNQGMSLKVDNFYREDPEVGIGVELSYASPFHLFGESMDTTLYEIRFYFMEENHVSEEEKTMEIIGERRKYCKLKDVPARYFSEIVRQISLVVGTCKGKNENWRLEISKKLEKG